MELSINGTTHTVSGDEGEPLLWVLRDQVGLTGTKFGCGIGVCGACTVHVDGNPVRSCLLPVSAVTGSEITTIEGLAGVDENGHEKLHPVQQAFLETQAPQCSWCMSGQMMTAAAFLKQNSAPSPEEIRSAMSANYCRCGCYVRIQSALALAADLLKEDAA